VGACLLTTVIAIILGVLTRHRGWCAICPMGFLQEKIHGLSKKV
jgi:polyferredoxin